MQVMRPVDGRIIDPSKHHRIRRVAEQDMLIEEHPYPALFEWQHHIQQVMITERRVDGTVQGSEQLLKKIEKRLQWSKQG